MNKFSASEVASLAIQLKSLPEFQWHAIGTRWRSVAPKISSLVRIGARRPSWSAHLAGRSKAFYLICRHDFDLRPPFIKFDSPGDADHSPWEHGDPLVILHF